MIFLENLQNVLNGKILHFLNTIVFKKLIGSALIFLRISLFLGFYVFIIAKMSNNILCSQKT
ncbi:hypothetical protein BLM37_02060 [Candidatus Gracilibacteria bacterium GN02-873]|nr:hypothetical protein BLM37_02060 [Candidatus Gracilibacteria bacterium GN02-873]